MIDMLLETITTDHGAAVKLRPKRRSKCVLGEVYSLNNIHVGQLRCPQDVGFQIKMVTAQYGIPLHAELSPWFNAATSGSCQHC